MAIFLDIPDIYGETYVEKRKQHQLETHDDHWGWIRCNSVTFGMEFPSDSSSGSDSAPTPSSRGTPMGRGSRSGSTGSEPTVDDITISKKLDYSSPKLAEAVCTRSSGNKWRVFRYAEIHVTNTQDEVIYKVSLKKVRILKYTFDLNDASAADPDETVVIGFKELKVEYTETSSEFYHDHSAFEYKVTEGGN